MRLGYSATFTRTSRPSRPSWRRSNERIDEFYCLGDVVGYGASPNECADIIRTHAKPPSSATTTRPSQAGWTTRTTTRRRARRSTSTPPADPENMAWLKQLPYKHERNDTACTCATARRCGSRSSSTSSRPSRRASAWRSGSSWATSRSSGTRTSARSSRLRPGEVQELPATQVQAARRAREVHRQRRVRGPAARLRQPRQLHDLRHRRAHVRVQARRVRHRVRRHRRSSRATSSATSGTASTSA
jgi:hypothetical protein